MYKTVTAVVLRTTKYSDKASILTVWSGTEGRLSLLVSATGGRESRRRRALAMPMTVVECVADFRPGRDILPVREMRAALVTPQVSAHPVKAAVAMFMAEVLAMVTREGSGPEPLMWMAVTDALTVLDTARSAVAVANFPLWFMMRLASVTGIGPDASVWRRGMYFDMTEGLFRTSQPLGGVFLEPQAARLTARLLELPARHLGKLRLGGGVRADALKKSLQYFTLHNIPLDRLRSPEVLHALLH